MSVGQGGHQAGTMMHLQRTGAGGHGQAPPSLQKAAAHEVTGLLHREGDRLPRLLQAHAGQGQARGWGAIPRLPEDVAVWRRRRWRPPLEGRLGGCTCKEHSLPRERALALSFPLPRTAGTPRAAEGPCGASPNSAGLLTSRHLLWAWSMLLLTGGGLLSACLKRWLLGWLGGGLEGWICNLCVQTQNQKQSPGISGEYSMIHL